MICEKVILQLLGRKKKFFYHDYKKKENIIKKTIQRNRIIVIGGAGSIGFSVVKLILKYNPLALHIIDINENKLVELVRYVRSSLGYTKGSFRTFPLDVGSTGFEAFIKQNDSYDIWLNFSALKHVRSEKDPFTLMRMIEVNFENTMKILKLAKTNNAKKFFSVSTDKACDPVSFLGATKRLMELAISSYSHELETSAARFGNVAFSDGSLLYSVINRMESNQPLVAPLDIKRYFITHEEAARLSLITAICAKSGEIYVPKLSKSIAQSNFPSIIKNFLKFKGYKMLIAKTENQARALSKKANKKSWPCLLFASDTAGEKEEEFFISKEDQLKKSTFKEIKIINTKKIVKKSVLLKLIKDISSIKQKKISEKKIKKIIEGSLKNFKHKYSSKSLEDKM